MLVAAAQRAPLQHGLPQTAERVASVGVALAQRLEVAARHGAAVARLVIFYLRSRDMPSFQALTLTRAFGLLGKCSVIRLSIGRIHTLSVLFSCVPPSSRSSVS